MNTKLNKSDYILLILYYGVAVILNIIDYKSRGLKTIEFWVDIPASLIISFITIILFMYIIIPKFLMKKKYLLFLISAFLTLSILGVIDDTLGFLSAGRKLSNLPKWYNIIINGVYTSSNNAGFLLGILFTKKFYEGQSQILKIEKQQKDNELKLLRSQIDPHFLFNNLNTLDSLIDSDAEKAKEYINRLSLIYRYLIKTKDAEVMELSKELQFAEHYIYLMKTRFGNDYDFKIEKQTDLTDKFIPTGALQTLLENVVKHNKPKHNETIVANIVINNKSLEVINHKGHTTLKKDSLGTGLENLKVRYQLLSDEEITILNTDKKFKVVIPIIKLSE
ncbi:histidine kinase [Tenacibaculum holothuriorum]|uniref:Histidine kinase n=1 Tax=Tenacibaculum holothuriorum TaxID=1635173 RepID=A0A1Y2PDQ7_9FLAO|nr:histidine kinase [Tenacibaculum holothuriorum]OSY88626.1 histidine kinase [Tenacibaculum holothuriorum]